MRHLVRYVCGVVLLLGLVLSEGARGGELEWRKVFELPDSRASFRTVWADADGWIAAGAQIIVVNRNGQVASMPQPGRTILSIASTSAGLFALGFDQAILRFDEGRWVEEHFSGSPPSATQEQRAAALLYGARIFNTTKGAVMGAYGPWRVLLRQDDHTWVEPPETERYRLDTLALLGPESPRPARCTRSEWLWLDGREGWFLCQDGRSFRTNGTATAATGRVPGACQGVGDDLAAVGKDFYLLCNGKLWKSSGARWDRMSGLKDVIAIAGKTRCLVAVTLSSVWESCSGAWDGSATPKTEK